MRRLLSVLVILCLAVGMLCIPVGAATEGYTLDASSGAVATASGFKGTVTHSGGTYSASYSSADLKNGGFYVLLSVTAKLENGAYKYDAISEGSIQYIDQTIASGTASNGSIAFTGFIPKSLGKDQVLLLGGKFNNGVQSPIALGVILSQGVEVSGWIQSYKPNVAATIEFFPAGTYESNKDNIANYEGTPDASGEVSSESDSTFISTQKFTVSGVGEGKYDVRITKPDHLDYWITGYEVKNTSDTMNSEGNPYLLRCGDVERTYTNGSIIITDLSVIIASENYNMSTADAVNKNADLDGSGRVDITDLSILIASENYMSSTIVEEYVKK